MSQGQLGLFDTPPSRQDIRLGLLICTLIFIGLLLILPLRQTRLPEINAFIPTIDAIMLVGELITATLLYAQGVVFRSRALTVLATGFLAAGLLLIPHALTFPGAFAENGLLGAGVNSTAWIASFRRGAFPIFIILFVLIQRAEAPTKSGLDRRPPKVGNAIFAASVLAGAVTLLATRGHDLLPAYFSDRTNLVYSNALQYQFVLFILFAIATVTLFRSRRSVLDMWLLVALAGWLAETLLVLTIDSRFTAGWYGLFVLTLFSHLVVMLALIAESNRLYARLALSTAARHRERETRAMSMDALAAAFYHEVGQPLTAVRLNATAALNCLSQQRPDIRKAIISLRAIKEGGKRSQDVLKSVRAMFGRGPNRATEFNINDLVRETIAILERELENAKITVDLALDEAVPLILADRVQSQQILVNLVVNAIESLAAKGRGFRRTRVSARCIGISTAQLNGQEVVIEVSDTGPGIATEDREKVFEPFFTTKPNGTGLGLSLCRIIAQEHGGSLTASHGEVSGVTFRLKLRTTSLDATAQST